MCKNNWVPAGNACTAVFPPTWPPVYSSSNARFKYSEEADYVFQCYWSMKEKLSYKHPLRNSSSVKYSSLYDTMTPINNNLIIAFLLQFMCRKSHMNHVFVVNFNKISLCMSENTCQSFWFVESLNCITEHWPPEGSIRLHPKELSE